jgi:hypothetical protein
MRALRVFVDEAAVSTEDYTIVRLESYSID